ncbi:hypothetical protein ACLOJK_013910 [Asimina triloba]
MDTAVVWVDGVMDGRLARSTCCETVGGRGDAVDKSAGCRRLDELAGAGGDDGRWVARLGRSCWSALKKRGQLSSVVMVDLARWVHGAGRRRRGDDGCCLV